MSAAEEVIEPALMKGPLSNPGRIVTKSRGTAADHMAVSACKPSGRGQATRSKTTSLKPKPLPSRQKLDAADKRLADAKAKMDRAKQDLEDEVTRLASRRRTVEHEHQTRIATLQDERDREEELHREAMDRWRAESE